MRVIAAHERDVQHVGQMHIIGEEGAAGEQQRVLVAFHGFANVSCCQGETSLMAGFQCSVSKCSVFSDGVRMDKDEASQIRVSSVSSTFDLQIGCLSFWRSQMCGNVAECGLNLSFSKFDGCRKRLAIHHG